MNGLDKIIEKIEADAGSVSASVIADAELRAKKIIEEAESTADAEAREIVSAAEAECASMVRRANSAGEHQKKKIMLSRKVSIIDSVISKAVKNFLSCEADSYFDAMLRLLEKYALTEDQIMVFSCRDFERMPADFERRAAKVVGNGAKITVKGEGSFMGGFLLIGDEITQNCTVEALLSDAETDIRDELNRLLFTE